MQETSDNNQLIIVRDLGMVLMNPTNKQKVHMAEYKCFCGELFTTRLSSVKNKSTQSCGCIHKKQLIERNKTLFNVTHNMTNNKLYGIWISIKQRVLNHKSKAFKEYGLRGITICDEWKNDFKAFYDWSIENGYIDGLTIDRRNNDGNYEPSNCRWTTNSVQSQNIRAIRLNNTSGYRGVNWHKTMCKWEAAIVVNRKKTHLGYYNTAYDAHIAYKTFVDENNLEHNYK